MVRRYSCVVVSFFQRKLFQQQERQKMDCSGDEEKDQDQVRRERLELAQEQFKLRYNSVDAVQDEAFVQDAIKKNQAKLAQERSKRKEELKRNVETIGNLEGEDDLWNMFSDETLKQATKRNVDNVAFQRKREENKTMVKVVVSRFISEEEACGREKADGSLCCRALCKPLGMCKECHANTTRRPYGVSDVEWEEMRKERKQMAKKRVSDRMTRNLDTRNKKRGKKSKPEEVQVEPQQGTKSSDCKYCSEPIEQKCTVTCAICRASFHDWAECMNVHKEACRMP
jgi:hypothetical protein